MREFTFQATLLASIRVNSETRAEAEQKLRMALAASDANLGMLDDAPIVVPVEIEGDLDLIETMESAGEESPVGRAIYSPARPSSKLLCQPRKNRSRTRPTVGDRRDPTLLHRLACASGKHCRSDSWERS
jgi:hypothetical protein